MEPQRAEHVPARRLLRSAERLRSGRRPFPSLPRLQWQPRLAVVPRNLPEQLLGLGLRPRRRTPGATCGPLPSLRTTPLRCAALGQRLSGRRHLRRRGQPGRNHRLRSLHQHLDAHEAREAAGLSQRRQHGLRRRTQGAHPLRQPVRRRSAHLGLRPAQKRVARSQAGEAAADRPQRSPCLPTTSTAKS